MFSKSSEPRDEDKWKERSRTHRDGSSVLHEAWGGWCMVLWRGEELSTGMGTMC